MSRNARSDDDDSLADVDDDLCDDDDLDQPLWAPQPPARALPDGRADAAALRGIAPMQAAPVAHVAPQRWSEPVVQPMRAPEPVRPVRSQSVTPPATVPPVQTQPTRRQGPSCLACIVACVRVVLEGVCGVWVLVCVAAEAARDALFLDPQYRRRDDAPDSSAVRGRLLALVVAQTMLLGLVLGMLGTAGLTGQLAEVTHTPFLLAQSPAIGSVLLGIYIYVFGALDPSTRSGDRVYSLYLVMEVATTCAGIANLIRYAGVYDDRNHLAAAIAPEHAPEQAPWDHGVCGQPHFVGAVLLVSSALWALLSGLNSISLIGRNRPKLKGEEHAPEKHEEQDDPDAVQVQMRTESGDTADDESRGRRRSRRRAARPPQWTDNEQRPQPSTPVHHTPQVARQPIVVDQRGILAVALQHAAEDS